MCVVLKTKGENVLRRKEGSAMLAARTGWATRRIQTIGS